MNRRYYSQRENGGKGKEKISLEDLKRFFKVVYKDFYERKYFCGKLKIGCCVDEGDNDISTRLLKTLRKDLWPICDEHENPGKLKEYTKNDLFDVIEFLFDGVSRPLKDADTHYHSWNGCGDHYSRFSWTDGQTEFREEINAFLNDFEDGYELSERGEIFHKADRGLDRLLNAKKVDLKKGDIKNRMIQAEGLFYNGRSSLVVRRNAVKELADCFEFLRDDLKMVLDKKDEADLFNIANNFGIRHHNKKQKTGYDPNIWLSWMFHFYLATLHATLRLIEKRNNKE